MNILMTGGGTGGHINPALAIAATVKKHDERAEIAFVGTKKGMENRLVPREGYEVHHIEIQGLSRSLSPKNIKTLYLTLTAPSKAKKLLKRIKPDLVVGTGGYVCYPLVRAACSLGIPTALHESNAQPGLAVKMLASKCDVVFTNFEVTGELLGDKCKGKIVNVGNPYREGSITYTKKAARKQLGYGDERIVLSCGGSLGAKTLNDCIVKYASNYLKNKNNTLLIHASGAKNYECVKEQYAEHGLDRLENIELLDYIYDMPARMAAADVIICRCGAMTLSELALTGKPAILIPSPNVTDDHQYKNGKVLADAGAAVLIRENELNEDVLNEQIERILSDADGYNKMVRAMKAFAHPDANEKIYSVLKELVENKK